MKKYLLFLPLFAAACNTGSSFESSEVLDSAYKVIEYTPAPGQFINERISGFDGVTDAAAACHYAQERLAAGDYVSLGGWGGYIVVQFLGPVEALTRGSELYVAGNPMPTSSEPGVVWVMEDTNHNELADDSWYELRGSEYDPQTGHNYSVTYIRPAADNQPVAWRDNGGKTGEIERMPQHTQPSYYPEWLKDHAELTFEGVRLPDNVGQMDVDGTPSWTPKAFAWGYADNYSTTDMAQGYNRFSIANAVKADGTAAKLRQIHFLKIQTGVNAKAPAIGEISTEVCRIACMRIVKAE